MFRGEKASTCDTCIGQGQTNSLRMQVLIMRVQFSDFVLQVVYSCDDFICNEDQAVKL